MLGASPTWWVVGGAPGGARGAMAMTMARRAPLTASSSGRDRGDRRARKSLGAEGAPPRWSPAKAARCRGRLEPSEREAGAARGRAASDGALAAAGESLSEAEALGVLRSFLAQSAGGLRGAEARTAGAAADVEAEARRAEITTPRCVWPRGEGRAAAKSGPAPRSEWPRRRNVALRAAGGAAAAGQSHAEADGERVTDAPAEAGASKMLLLQAQPRQQTAPPMRPRAALPPRLAVPAPEAAPDAVVKGAHSAWPRSQAFSAAVAAIDVEPAQVAAVMPVGPHSAWPKAQAMAAAVERADDSALMAQSAPAAGAHCSWPRATAMCAAAAVAPAPEGPACEWPREKLFAPVDYAPGREPKPEGSSDTRVAAFTVDAAPEGPACEWPREKLGAPVDYAPGREPEPEASGARCAWPRETKPEGSSDTRVAAISVETNVAATKTVAAITPQGAACAWPQAPSKKAAMPTSGPRCAWPKA